MLRSWKVIVRHPEDGYSEGDMVTSGGSFSRWVTLYIIANSKLSAQEQARQMVGWAPGTTGKVSSTRVLAEFRT